MTLPYMPRKTQPGRVPAHMPQQHAAHRLKDCRMRDGSVSHATYLVAVCKGEGLSRL